MSTPESSRFKSAHAGLKAFRIHGFSPFCGSPTDISCELMECAHGLLATLEEAWRTSDNVRDGQQNLGNLSPAIHAKAMEGVASLIALALYLSRGEVA